MSYSVSLTIERLLLGVFEDRGGLIFNSGDWYSAIALSFWNPRTTAKWIYLFKELRVTERDLFIVNFERLKDKVNIVVCFRIDRGSVDLVLTCEAEIGAKTVEFFERYFELRKKIIVCFGLRRQNDIIIFASDWHIPVYHYTEYDGRSLQDYLCGRYS